MALRAVHSFDFVTLGGFLLSSPLEYVHTGPQYSHNTTREASSVLPSSLYLAMMVT